MSQPDFDFDSLTRFHDLVNELLHSPHTKHEIIRAGHREWAHHVSEASLKMADSCASAKDLLLLARDHLRSLQSASRHVFSSGDLTSFAPHRLPRKQLKKAILKRLHSLEGMGPAAAFSAASPPPEEGRSLAAVADLLEEARATTLSIVRSLMSLIAIPNPESSGSGRKDPVFVRIKLTRVDSLRFWEKCDVAEVRAVGKKLEGVEMVVEEMEGELEDMFRRLIRTRASLLNILTN